MSAVVQCCEPPDPCKELRDKIDELINRNKRTEGNGGTHGLKWRFEEQIYGANGPNTTSWANHDKAIKEQQAGLRDRLNDWNKNNCGEKNPLPENAWEWATKPRPQAADWVAPASKMQMLKDGAKLGAQGVLAGGALYALYRAARLVPSLLPPLWWTIPANVAVP